jgi:hypothetical protein
VTSFYTILWRVMALMIERLLEIGLVGIIVGSIAISLQKDELFLEYEGIIELGMILAFAPFFFYFFSLYGLSCILFSLAFRISDPRRHANRMMILFSLHTIILFLYLTVSSVASGNGFAPDFIVDGRINLIWLYAVFGIPVVWVANYTGAICYRWGLGCYRDITLSK